MYRSQKLALRYFAAAIALFGVMTAAGLLSALYYFDPALLYNVFDFHMAKILHINTLVIWLLMGFIGAVYWFLPKELGREVVGIWLAEVLFYVFCAAVAIVAAVFIFIQYGRADQFNMWFINQGRKYIEAPRWAAAGIVVVVLTFVYNVTATAWQARKMTGLLGVLILDLVPLSVLYLDAFP
jgi:nitric oxide reductase subunit B